MRIRTAYRNVFVLLMMNSKLQLHGHVLPSAALLMANRRLSNRPVSVRLIGYKKSNIVLFCDARRSHPTPDRKDQMKIIVRLKNDDTKRSDFKLPEKVWGKWLLGKD